MNEDQIKKRIDYCRMAAAIVRTTPSAHPDNVDPLVYAEEAARKWEREAEDLSKLLPAEPPPEAA